MFRGEYVVNVGEKNRIAIPKKFRDQFEGGVVLTRGFEGTLIIEDEVAWKNTLSKIEKSALFSKDARDLKRYLIGGAIEIETDAQGRFVMPETLKSFAEISNKVVFIGINEWIELWPYERWQKYLESIKIELNNISKRTNA